MEVMSMSKTFKDIYTRQWKSSLRAMSVQTKAWGNERQESQWELSQPWKKLGELGKLEADGTEPWMPQPTILYVLSK